MSQRAADEWTVVELEEGKERKYVYRVMMGNKKEKIPAAVVLKYGLKAGERTSAGYLIEKSPAH